ncbi:putative cytochrome c oxidase assembly factor 7A [Apostichopus japonicus]|uniref:Putative cytochrome c oxidase assembly factor 7A n=1 Tax=Stichopus japonicus TaxID=307972 RepID=A0A2G8JYK4_STIJA|nr:putative cytochrome c oxidase assembly factor 7A [Apostichopus japonicus]
MFAVDFKNEEEVQGYLKRLGTEFSYQCYKEKSGEGCLRLGDFFSGIKKDYEQASVAYTKSCEDYGQPRGCSKLAAQYLYGKGVTKDIPKAMKYFTKSCDGGSVEGCYGIASILVSDQLNPAKKKEATKATSYFDKSCDKGHGESCFRISAMYLTGLGDLSKNLTKSREYAAKSCELNNVYGCANLGRMYALGDGGEQNEELAKKYRNKAKDLHKEAKDAMKQLKFGEK